MAPLTVWTVPGLMEALKPRKGGAVPAPKKYPDELRERAIRFALDLVDGPEKLSVNAASKRVGEQLGIVPDSLRNWVQQARIDAGAKPGLTGDEQARLRELEREVRELRRAHAILRSASAFFAAGLDRHSRADRLHRPAPRPVLSRADLPRPVRRRGASTPA